MTQSIARGLDSLHLDSPLLQGFTEVEFIRDILSTQAPDPRSQEEIRGFEARILKKHLRKTVIDYTVRFTSSTKNYIGLHRESDERLGHAFSALKTLKSNGFGEDIRLRVPDPILYLPALSFLLMGKAEGQTLRETIERKDDCLPYVRGAARWLAKLHGSNVRLDGISDQDDEVDASLRFTRAAAWLFPRLRSKVQSISEQLISLQEALRPGPRKPIHGDYHPKNIIVSLEQTTVVDFDEARMGDPAFDLGYFVAQTKMTHGTGDAITEAMEVFLQEYRENQSTLPRDFAKTVAIFEAQTYLQRIYHTNYLLALKPDFDLISEWLSQCETSLRKARSPVQQMSGKNT